MGRGLGRYGEDVDVLGLGLGGLGLAAMLPGVAGMVLREADWARRKHPQEPRQHDFHVRAYERHLRRLEYARREEAARLAKLERDKPIMDAAAAKRARKQARNLAKAGKATDQ